MKTYLSDHIGNRDNNFNLIRFIAAFLVLFSHSFALYYGSAATEPGRSLLGFTLGSIAVDIFFITSGLLVCASLESRKGLMAFTRARVLRIYPALFAALILIVMVVGPLFSTLSLSDYFADFQTTKYLIRNSILFLGVEHQLPGVFEDAPFQGAVNGSLWTLPYEVRMYALLCIVTYSANWASGKFSMHALAAKNIFLAIAVALFAGMVAIKVLEAPLPGEKFIRLAFMFSAGAAAFHHRHQIRLGWKYAITAVIILAIASIELKVFAVAYLLTASYLTLFFAYVPGGVIRRFNGFGDYSYGLYIYAFTIQQMLIVSFPGLALHSYILYSALWTLLIAAGSWHVIEKPMLRYKSMSQNTRIRRLQEAAAET